jgi:hypothetical protein
MKSLLDILVNVLMEAEEETPEDRDDTLAPNDDPADQPVSNMDVLMDRFKILRYVLEDLLVPDQEAESERYDDMRELLDDIQIVAYKPTTFKVIFRNGEKMNLIYNPTPAQTDPVHKMTYKARDFFQCRILGKKFKLQNRSEYLSAIDYIGQALDGRPVGGANNQTNNQAGTEEPEATPNPEAEPNKKEKSAEEK